MRSPIACCDGRRCGAAAELNTTSGPGLEATLARISAEVTAEATAKREAGKNSASI